MQPSPLSPYLVSLGSQYLPQHPVVEHPQSLFLTKGYQVSHPYEATGPCPGKWERIINPQYTPLRLHLYDPSIYVSVLQDISPV